MFLNLCRRRLISHWMHCDTNLLLWRQSCINTKESSFRCSIYPSGNTARLLSDNSFHSANSIQIDHPMHRDPSIADEYANDDAASGKPAIVDELMRSWESKYCDYSDIKLVLLQVSLH